MSTKNVPGPTDVDFSIEYGITCEIRGESS